MDINSAISEVDNGGTVYIGSGVCSLSGTVNVNKPITLAGAGGTSTTFVGQASPMITVSHGASGFARVTGIYFNSNVDTAVRLLGTISQVRIDSNRCVDAYHCVYASGRVEGVVDNNMFINCDRCVYAAGTEDSAWNLDFDSGSGNYRAGSSRMLFVDTNLFKRSASYTGSDEQVFYTQEAARTVFRYNTVDLGEWGYVGVVAHDSHGNQLYYDEPGVFRGQPIHEIYENTYVLRVPRPNGQVFDLRSGSNIIFNNTIRILEPRELSGVIELWEEEAESGSGRHFTEPGFDRTWPTEDMVTNTFIWNNTINGSPLTASNIAGNGFGYDCCGAYPNSQFVINFNRDVWMHAPQSSGGRTYYNGRPGASGRNSDGTLVFTPSGPNAYYPYSPYTYPHPLTSDSRPPSAPTGLRIIP